MGDIPVAAKHTVGIVGCGDFLRWMADDLQKSKKIAVTSLFDLNPKSAARYAEKLGGTAVKSVNEIIENPAIDIVCLFVPPWVRKDLVVRAARAGKHILTTKPLAPTSADCTAMVRAVERADVRCGVIYRRTGNSAIELYKQIFERGSIGKLALYKQDWLHHYPEWNTWALDPKKNGGPFMDAMIHNLNIARYLMGRPAVRATFFADNHAHKLPCYDTEGLKIDFQHSGAAHLFITWAADLAVFNTDGNNREHIDKIYMVTDKGWYLTEGWTDAGFTVTASRAGVKRQWVAKPLPQTLFDAFAAAVATGKPLRRDIPSIQEAAEDIAITTRTAAKPGQIITLKA